MGKLLKDLTLLIDDDKPDTIIDMINSFNNNLVIMQDIYEALDRFENNNYDLIIMKVFSGETAKIEFVKRIKRNHDIPIIAIFSDFNRDNIKRFVDSGLDDFIIKPIMKKEAIENTITNLIKK